MRQFKSGCGIGVFGLAPAAHCRVRQSGAHRVMNRDASQMRPPGIQFGPEDMCRLPEFAMMCAGSTPSIPTFWPPCLPPMRANESVGAWFQRIMFQAKLKGTLCLSPASPGRNATGRDSRYSGGLSFDLPHGQFGTFRMRLIRSVRHSGHRPGQGVKIPDFQPVKAPRSPLRRRRSGLPPAMVASAT